MPKTKSRRKLTPLTNEQVEVLAETICDEVGETGKDALMVLADEISRQPYPRCSDIAEMVKRVAFFSSVSGDDSIDALADLLRGEVRV